MIAADFGMRTPWPSMARATAVLCALLLSMAFSGSGFALIVESGTADEAARQRDREFSDEKMRAEQGDPRAQYELGIDCIYRQKGTAADGLHWLLQAAAGGQIDAEAQAGICYAEGLGTERNAEESLRLLRDAAAKGNAYALEKLGALSIDGFGPLPRDLKQAEKYFAEAIGKGAPWAENGLKRVRDLMKSEDHEQGDGKQSR